jgi:hypothetical protein
MEKLDSNTSRQDIFPDTTRALSSNTTKKGTLAEAVDKVN